MKLLLLIAFIFTLQLAKADAWDNLNLKQAKAAQKYLQKYPFIYDYCDCCGGEVYLMQVLSAEIIPCSWDAAQYSVAAKVERLALMQNSGTGLNNYHTDEISEEEKFADYTITMNYTFVFDPRMKWAVPFFKIIPYHLDHVCRGATVFPDPTGAGVKISNEDYKVWYDKNIRPKKSIQQDHNDQQK
jgi:hypothetical protein